MMSRRGHRVSMKYMETRNSTTVKRTKINIMEGNKQQQQQQAQQRQRTWDPLDLGIRVKKMLRNATHLSEKNSEIALPKHQAIVRK